MRTRGRPPKGEKITPATPTIVRFTDDGRREVDEAIELLNSNKDATEPDVTLSAFVARAAIGEARRVRARLGTP